MTFVEGWQWEREDVRHKEEHGIYGGMGYYSGARENSVCYKVLLLWMGVEEVCRQPSLWHPA